MYLMLQLRNHTRFIPQSICLQAGLQIIDGESENKLLRILIAVAYLQTFIQVTVLGIIQCLQVHNQNAI